MATTVHLPVRISRDVKLLLRGTADLPFAIDDVAEVVAADTFGDLPNTVYDVTEVVTAEIVGIYLVVSHCSEKS